MEWCVKEMRMPCWPSVQSRGCEAGSKWWRKVMLVERVGSSEGVMGVKRVSSKALGKGAG